MADGWGPEPSVSGPAGVGLHQPTPSLIEKLL